MVSSKGFFGFAYGADLAAEAEIKTLSPLGEISRNLGPIFADRALKRRFTRHSGYGKSRFPVDKADVIQRKVLRILCRDGNFPFPGTARFLVEIDEDLKLCPRHIDGSFPVSCDGWSILGMEQDRE